MASLLENKAPALLPSSSALGNKRLPSSNSKTAARCDQAAARAKICAGCRLNSKGFCTTCNGLKGYVLEVVGPGGALEKRGKLAVLR